MFAARPRRYDVGAGSRACAPNTSISTTLPPFKITPAVLTEYGSALPAVPGSGRDSKDAHRPAEPGARAQERRVREVAMGIDEQPTYGSSNW